MNIVECCLVSVSIVCYKARIPTRTAKIPKEIDSRPLPSKGFVELWREGKTPILPDDWLLAIEKTGFRTSGKNKVFPNKSLTGCWDINLCEKFRNICR